MKKKYDIKVCAIVPDIPEFMITYRKDYSPIRRWLNSIDVSNSERYRNCIDGYVFLSRFMDEMINKYHKPYVVVDGICDIAVFPQKNNKTDEKFVLYAGKISSMFGVDMLVDAFLGLDREDYKLVLCGDGDYADKLREIANKNDNIQFLGSIPHKRVLELEINADLLVDPRPSDVQLVKMSFPSKIIEYMASGTPVLTTNLPCFDDVYRKYQYRIEDESVEGIQKALNEVLGIEKTERRILGKSAKEFIYQNKTISKQCKIIFNLIDEVC